MTRLEGAGRIAAGVTFAFSGLALSADNHPVVAAEPSPRVTTIQQLQQENSEFNLKELARITSIVYIAGWIVAGFLYRAKEAFETPDFSKRGPAQNN